MPVLSALWTKTKAQPTTQPIPLTTDGSSSLNSLKLPIFFNFASALWPVLQFRIKGWRFFRGELMGAMRCFLATMMRIFS